MKTLFKRWLFEQNGATAIEYVLIGAGVGIAISAAVFLLGDVILGFFEAVDGSIT